MHYLVHNTKEKPLAHYWENGDTRCAMVSTGHLSLKNYHQTNDLGKRRICKLCRSGAQMGPAGNGKHNRKKRKEPTVFEILEKRLDVIEEKLDYIIDRL